MDNNSPDLLPSVQQPQTPNHGEQFSVAPDAYPAPSAEPRTEKEQSRAVERGFSSAPPANGQQQPVLPSDSGQTSDPTQAATPLYTPVSNDDHPQIAEDTDLIEDEWVAKAKEIVARTSQNPHQQNKEMTVMKASYLKKRYNKDIKVSED